MKLLFTAEILQIIVAVISGMPVLSLLAGIGGLVILIITLMGLKKAGLDQPLYKKAFSLTIIQLVVVFAGKEQLWA